MSKPANLEYAFPGHQGSTSNLVVAYRIVGTAHTDEGGTGGWDAELDAALAPGFDYNSTTADGDGSPGQYVVYQSDPDTSAIAAALGWDPFDPKNHQPTTTRYWELQPGSDVMATTIGVLPKIGTAYGLDIYMGLVTVAAGQTMPNMLDSELGTGWFLRNADTVMSPSGWSSGGGDVSEGEPIPAGVHLASYWIEAGSPPPFAFPEGWTPGNTTGEGPVLPRLFDYAGTPVWGGLAIIEAGAASSSYEWFYADSATPLTAEAYANTTLLDDAPASSGLYTVFYDPAVVDAPGPTSLPPGWTFRPYGIGPVAITDENAGGVIGDIAYVVSGYVYNSQNNDFAAAISGPPAFTFTPGVEASHVFAVGETFVRGEPDGVQRVTAAGTITETPAAGLAASGGAAWEDYYIQAGNFWPYLERYDLKNKTWLPRVPLPEVLSFFTVTPSTYPVADVTNGFVRYAGWYELEAGELPLLDETAPGEDIHSYWLQSETNEYFTTATDHGYNTQVLAYPAGLYRIGTQSFLSGDPAGTTTEAMDPEAIAASLGGVAVDRPLGPYAAEGGIAGVINGKLYFGGGDGDNITGSEFFCYDPVTGEFERLEDVPAHLPYGTMLDYSPYGVVAGKLWGHIGQTSPGQPLGMVCYEPGVGWSTHVVDVVGLPGDLVAYDQIQGVEIGGKLYFAYDKVYVFDPKTLTVEAKAAVPVDTITSFPCATWGANGKVWCTSNNGATDERFTLSYDPATDTWATEDRPGSLSTSYSTAIAYRNVPFVFSGVFVDNQNAAGAYALTGNVSAFVPVTTGTLSVQGGTLTIV